MDCLVLLTVHHVYVEVTYTLTTGMSDQKEFLKTVVSSSKCKLEQREIWVALERRWRGEATETEPYPGQTGLPHKNNKYSLKDWYYVLGVNIPARTSV